MRITKETAREFIVFAKSLKISAHYWDPKATSAFAFGRQMVSPKLKKANPSFECSVVQLDNFEPAKLTAEFLDGSKWETPTGDLRMEELRAQFFLKCQDAEDNVDVGPADKKGGDKGGKKK
jgi:hypothetical protein